MARTAAQFTNHTTFPAFSLTDKDGNALPWPTADGLTSEAGKVIASDIVRGADNKADANASRSGEIEVPVFKAANLESALALYGGSESDLIAAAVAAYNDKVAESAKRFVTAEIEGPEKRIAKLIAKLAKHFDTDEAALKAKIQEKPEYLDMLLNLAK